MKKIILLGVIASISISTIGCTSLVGNKVLANEPEQLEEQLEVNNDEVDKAKVIEVVEDFGGKLQNVSLLAPSEQVEESMKENYGELVDKELIEKWLDDLGNAPGRLVSSPWPDHIKVEGTDKISDSIYTVKGEIVEKTNTEDEVSTQSIILQVEKIDGNWIIKDLSLGEYK